MTRETKTGHDEEPQMTTNHPDPDPSGDLHTSHGEIVRRVDLERAAGLSGNPRRADASIAGHEAPWYDGDLSIRIRVTPRSAHDVYVADWGAALADPRYPAPAADRTTARARTIVPITAYSGGFAHPVVLIRRELGLDEVGLVGDGGEIHGRREGSP